MSEESIFNENETSLNDSVLTQLKEMCDAYKSLKIEIAKKESELKEVKERFEQVSREHIPSLLNSHGLSEIKLASGEKVVVTDKVKASIANKNYIQAYRSMVEAEGGDAEKVDALFKSQAVIEDVSDNILDILLEHDIPYESKKNIHHQTLNKYCKERLEQGLQIPEGISVFQFQETKIKS